MSDKPEALRLAHELDAYHNAPHHKLAAAELRRLHADNERLRRDAERLTATAFQAQNAAIDLAQRYKRLRGLLLDIRNDAQTSHWHRDIDEALQEPPR